MTITNVVLLVEVDGTKELRRLIMSKENRKTLLYFTEQGMFSDDVVKLEEDVTAHLSKKDLG